ncbi:sn-glycerol-3-phosphate ABC transporter ATP-binding protein UgpC [candidate division KSB1 bacterium]|nr:sn-glycerol-3-phosphate ABC transporter ATP-binding protein UgpC [candidate division KSB1 bacterium]
MASVELRNVTKVYHEVTAVHSASATIEDKEFIVLVGPSGCGKSTILRMIAGLEDISSGQILIDNQVVNEVPPKDRDIAMVFQNYALYPHMTVYANLAFGLKLRKFPKQEIDQRVKEAASILGIEHLLERKPKALSGGQRQRVAVGRAIVRKPKVFLFDEPLSNLDAKLRVQMRTEISKLHSRLESTMIYVTHDQVEAMTMGDRIVVLRDGIIQQIDSPLNLYNRPVNKFVAGFIGSPAMNFLNGTLVAENGLKFKCAQLKLTIAEKHQKILAKYLNKEIVLGIRPENLVENIKSQRYQIVKGNVDVVEPMGNEIFLYLSFGENSVVARLNPNTKPVVNTEYSITFDMDKVHYFDPVTEEAIYC